MGAPGPEAPEPGGIPPTPGGGGNAPDQILQEIEGKLAELAQASPEPEVQRAIQGIQKQVEPLQQILGAQQAQNMQSGLANPSGGGAPGGTEEAPAGGAGMPEDHAGHHTIEIQIKPGGPKDFGSAKKAAMAQHAASGHFDPGTPKGETPSSPRTKAKAKG